MKIRTVPGDARAPAIGALCLALFAPCAVRAWGPAEGSPAKTDATIDTVVVRGSLRNSELASGGQVQVIPNAELLKFGQVPLGEALSRNGAIVITTGRNGNQEITLSGLGDGYTQVLLNGSKVPRGFSLDTLSADNVESVEIVRSPNSEAGARGIAGTINIVMKKMPAAERTAGLKATVSAGWSDGHQIDGTYSRARGDGSALVQVGERRNTTDREARNRIDETVYGTRRRFAETALGPAVTHEQNLVPKWEWQSSGHAMILDALYQRSRQERVTRTQRERVDAVGPRSEGETSSRISRDTWSGSVTYRDDDAWRGGQFETKWTLSANDRVSEGLVRDDTLPPDQRLRLVEYPSHSRSHAGKLKFRTKAADHGQYTFGVQYDHAERDEAQTVIAATREHAEYDIEITDTAAFLQWDRKTPAGSNVQAGLRVEQVRLGYAAVDDDSTRNFHFLAPQASWSRKVGGSGNTLSLALNRAIRIPDEADFSTRTYLSVFNSPSSPDQRGNPALRPETATSLELGWSRPKGAKTEVRTSLTYKRLEHVITQELLRDTGAWVMRPTNVGGGDLWISDLNLRRPFTFTSGGGARIKGNASVSLSANASSVELGDGRRGRIATSVPYQASVGLDLQGGEKVSWTTGVQWVYRPGYDYRLPGNVRMFDSARRTLDLQGSLRLSKHFAMRLTLANLLQRSRTSVYDHDGGNETTHAVSRIRDGATVRFGMEWSL